MPFIDDEFYTPASVQDAFSGHPSEATLAKWRTRGEGPAFVKVGRSVIYRGADLNDWLRSRTVTHTNATAFARGRDRKTVTTIDAGTESTLK